MQKLFSEFQGVRYIDTTVNTNDPRDHGIAASATCQDQDCTQLAFKVSWHMLLFPLAILHTLSQLITIVALLYSVDGMATPCQISRVRW